MIVPFICQIDFVFVIISLLNAHTVVSYSEKRFFHNISKYQCDMLQQKVP